MTKQIIKTFFVVALFSIAFTFVNSIEIRPATAQAGWESSNSDHYAVKTNAGKKKGEDLLEFMELVFETYCDVFDFKPKIKRKFSLKLYKDKDSYSRDRLAPKGSSAYYSSQMKLLVKICSEGKWDISTSKRLQWSAL